MKLLDKDQRVWVEIEKYQPDLSEYDFVAFRGKLKAVPNQEERFEVIEEMAEYGKHKLSKNLLAAHGSNKGEDWSSFTPETLGCSRA